MGYNIEQREIKPKRSEKCDYLTLIDAYMVLINLSGLRLYLCNYL